MRHVHFHHRVAGLLLVAAGLASRAVPAKGQSEDSPSARASGKPQVHLDRLTFPSPESRARFAEHLRQTLAKEAKRVDWGAHEGSRIEYRFAVEKLELTRRDRVLEVHCAALGRLPKGKSARGTLSYGGDPSDPARLVRRVLDIVARGVMTRLAELERIRRGQLRPVRVRAPTGG